jgi:hypothetical protein
MRINRMRNQILLEAAHARQAMDDVRLYWGDQYFVGMRPLSGNSLTGPKVNAPLGGSSPVGGSRK